MNNPDANDLMKAGRWLSAEQGEPIEVLSMRDRERMSRVPDSGNTNGSEIAPAVVRLPVARAASEDASQPALRPIFAGNLPTGVADDSDLANATLLQQCHGADLLHSGKLGWLAWDGTRFRLDDSGEVSRRVQEVARRLALGAAELFRRAALARSKDESRELHERAEELDVWARKLQNRKGSDAAISVAQTLMPVRPDDLDADPWLLCCTNGTVDLRTGVLKPHDRADKITKRCPVNFEPNAPAPRFERFVEEILPAADVRAFVQRYLGYSLTGSTREHCFVIALGPGGNGKSVLSEAVRHVLGDYSSDTPSDTIMSSKNSRGTENDIARLRGSRFVTAKEIEQGKRLDEARVKQLVGGDTVTARFLFHEFFEFVPSFKLWVYANHRPQIRGTDEGIWRRIALVNFDQCIPADKRDVRLPEKLRDESSGILAWLVRGCLEWQRSGLQPPSAVRAATEQYRAESNDVARFVDECCVIADFASVKVGTLFDAYRKWLDEQGGNPLPLAKNVFSERLTALGRFTATRTNASGRVWKGIGLTAETSHGEEA